MAISKQSSEQDAPQLVKADPTRKMLKNNMVIMTIVGLFWFGLAIAYLFVNIGHSNGTQFLFLIYLAMGILYLTVPFLRHKRGESAWKRYEERRQLAAQGDREQVPLAAEQPVPDALALPLSAILRSKDRPYIIILIFTVLFLLVVLISVSIEVTLLFLSVIRIDTVLIISNIVILLIFLVLTILGAVFRSRSTVQQLEFTEAGLLKRTGKKVIVVPWDEARLFAITPASPGIKKVNGPPTNYELSSANEVLRWFASERAGAATTLSGEYYQQMQALLAVIAARTGLPLYDLR